jgi:hypothetical protein
MGRKINSEAVYHGDHFEPRGSDEFVRCSRCGFPCKLDRDMQGSEGSKLGWGITYTAFPIVTTDYNSLIDYEPASAEYNYNNVYDNDQEYDGGTGIAYDGVERTIYDPIVTSGCPQCGTFLYNK